MNIRFLLLPTFAVIAALSSACSDDSPSSQADTPAGCESNVLVAHANGFMLTGGQLTAADVNLDSSTGPFSRTFGQIDNDIEYSMGGEFAVGADTLAMTLDLAFIGGSTGTRNWDNLAAGSGSHGVVLSITSGDLAGNYRSVAGRTTLTSYYDNFDADSLSFAGTFCGTLKDSLNRTLTVEGGKFTYTN